MYKRRIIQGILLLLLIVLFTPGCTPPPPPVQNTQTTVQETPPPDYTVIDTALKDPNQGVKLQAIAHLNKIDHITALDRLLQVILDNPTDRKITTIAAEGIKKFGDKAINPVKDNLWKSEHLPVQEAAFNILSTVNKTPEFYLEVKDRFYAQDIQYNRDAAFFRQSLAKFIMVNADKENIETIPDIIAMIQLQDEQVANMAGNTISSWKDSRVIEPLFHIFYNNKDNTTVVQNMLKILYNLDAPNHGVDPAQMLDDITLILETYGSYNRKIQGLSYESLKKFGYGDPLIIDYISKFENCDNAVVRTHTLDLLQTLPQKQYPPGITPPTFEIPANSDRGSEYCSYR